MAAWFEKVPSLLPGQGNLVNQDVITVKYYLVQKIDNFSSISVFGSHGTNRIIVLILTKQNFKRIMYFSAKTRTTML